jgi:hypothetical protein
MTHRPVRRLGPGWAIPRNLLKKNTTDLNRVRSDLCLEICRRQNALGLNPVGVTCL